MSINQTAFQKLLRVKKKLEDQRSLFLPEWKEVAKYTQPSARFDNPEPGTAGPGDYDLYDSTGMDASNTMADGLISNACGRNIDWFRIRPENHKVKSIADQRNTSKNEEVLYDLFNASGFYDECRPFFRSCEDFATATMLIGTDLETGLPTFRHLPLGTYLIAEGPNKIVDTLFWDFWLTVEEAIETYGKDALPSTLSTCEEPYKCFKFCQYIGPATKLNLGVPGEGDYVKITWAESDTNKTIEELRQPKKGFAAWRWARGANCVWGVDSPGMTQKSNMKMLQSMGKDVICASQLHGRPPFKATKGLQFAIKPAGIIYLESGQDMAPVSVTGDLSWTNNNRADLREQIRDAYYVDFFLTLTAHADKEKTAEEAAGLKGEKAEIMASFTGRLAMEFFEPCIEAMWEAAKVLGVLEVPEEEQATYFIDYVSRLYLLQQELLTVRPTDAVIARVCELAQIEPTILDILDLQAYIKDYADKKHANMNVIRTDEMVEKIQALRNEMTQQVQAQQMELEQLKAGSQAYKNMSVAPQSGSPAESMNGGVA